MAIIIITKQNTDNDNMKNNDNSDNVKVFSSTDTAVEALPRELSETPRENARLLLCASLGECKQTNSMTTRNDILFFDRTMISLVMG